MGLSDYLRLTLGFRFYSEKQIRAYQLKTIRRNFALAQAKAPYYASIGPKNGIQSWEDFKALPMMDKKILMDHFDTINTLGYHREDVEAYALDKEARKDYSGYYQDQVVVGLSSGTSGNKGLFLTDKALTKRLPFVFLARSGLSLSYLPFNILFCLRVFSQGFADIRAPLIHLKYCSTMTPPEEAVQLINASHINILMAPPSFVRLLLPHRDQIKSLFSCIVCYAEVLSPEEKAKFSEFFHCRVIEIYQASEGQVASLCKAGNLHLNEDLVFAELYDEQGNPVTQAGIPGQLVLTNLVNTVQPLFRYKMNDWVVLKEGCPCGSHYRVLDRVIGRQDDIMMFLDKDGQLRPVFPDLISRWIITTSNAIREFKVIQPKPNVLELTLDCGTQAPQDLLETLHHKLLNEFQAYGIKPKLSLTLAPITYPQDNAKFKRFEIRKDQP